MEAYLQMSQFEILHVVEKYYPIKLFVKIIVGSICKIAKYKRNIKKAETYRVGIICLNKIGDSIFTVHTIRKIVEFHPDKIISIICFPETKAIFQLVFQSVEIITIPRNYFWKGRIATRNAKKILQKERLEIIYDLTGAITSATLIVSSTANKIVGMNLEYFKPLYDYYIPIRNTPHLIDIYMDVVRQVMPIANNLNYEFPLTQSSSKKILIHPHAGWKAKEWGIEKYLEVAKKLSSQYEVEFITERGSLVEGIKEEIKEKFKLIETKSVEDLIKEIKNCGAFIGNDSGPIYIANILGKPTLTIYGPTNPNYSKPFGKHHTEIHKEVSCSPTNAQYCFADAGRKCPNYICMRNLTVDEVYRKILDFLSKEKIQNRVT